MKNVWTLTRIRILLALRNRIFVFFSVVMPLGFLFIYAFIFARSVPQMVGYMFPAILALTVMGSFWGLSVQLVLYREQGILRRFRLTPIGPGAMLASGILSNYLLTLPTLLIEFAIMDWFFRVPSFGNLFGAAVLITLGMVAFSSFGLIIASVANSMQETQVLNNILWFPLIFLSGATYPYPLLPGWLQAVGAYLPATHLVTGLQKVMVAGSPLSHTGPELLALSGGAVLAFFISSKLFRWEPEEKVGRQAKLWAAAALVPFLLLGAWENANGHLRSDARSILRNVASEPDDDSPPPQQQTPPPPDSASPPQQP